MSPILSRGFRAIEAQRREVISLLDGLDESARIGKTKPSDWSPLQIAEHLLIGDETVGSREWASAKWANRKKSPHNPLLFAFVLWALRRNISLPLPAPELEPQGQTPWPELQTRWEQTRAQLQQSLKLPIAVRRSFRPFAHQIIGALSAREMLLLAQVHNAYHLRQLKAVLRNEAT